MAKWMIPGGRLAGRFGDAGMCSAKTGWAPIRPNAIAVQALASPARRNTSQIRLI